MTNVISKHKPALDWQLTVGNIKSELKPCVDLQQQQKASVVKRGSATNFHKAKIIQQLKIEQFKNESHELLPLVSE